MKSNYLSHTIKNIPNRLKVKYEWETIRPYTKVPSWLSREEIFESITTLNSTILT